MLTVDRTPWGEVTTVTTVSSSNVVYKFVGGGQADVLWIKGAPGLNRVQFANDTMNRLALPSRSRIIAWGDDEHNVVLNTVTRAGDQDSKNKLDRIRNEAFSLLVMPDGGKAFFEHMDAQGGSDAEVRELRRLFSMDSIRNDMARIIAADLLLGNFDRFGVNSKGGIFHMGNFALDLSAGARFVPIDNDVVSPSIDHVVKPEVPGKPKPEELYAVVIHGGRLNDPHQAFPSANQSDMSGLLGPNAEEKIASILYAALPDINNEQARREIRPFARQIVPLVRQHMSTLLGELKHPGGDREGLNALMKAQQNVEGMNYDTFKLKSRFADLMLDAQNFTPREVDIRAAAYQKYRCWKQALPRLFAPASSYPLPNEWLGDQV
jgi:hypothetical protein